LADIADEKIITVDRISAPKPYDVLADQLRERILRGEIPEGASLPAERELVSQTGLTRGSVREALRVLAVEGLIQTRPGRYGGNVVTLPGSGVMSDNITKFIRGRNMPHRLLHETREALEPTLARWTALRRSEADLRELKALHERLVASVNDLRTFSLINVQWHVVVAAASGNELLSSVVRAISYGVHLATSTEEYDTMETRQAVIRVHSRINEAIENRDGEMAERRMREHVTATRARAQGDGHERVPLLAPRKPRAAPKAKSPAKTSAAGTG
jgi:GntR family transcriptional repressor for pyruvate dehydrogenase complex